MDTLLDKIDKIIQELLLIDGLFRADWERNKHISKQDIQNFEKEIGTTLPQEYRQYVLKYGMGGPYLRDDLDCDIPTNLKLSDQEIAYAKKPFPYERTSIQESNGRQKQNIKKVLKDADSYDGTLSLGVPTGTHVYFQLVLNGKYAGEVWKGNGNLRPNKKASFLEMNLSYFKKRLQSARKKAQINTKILEGKAHELITTNENSLPDLVFPYVEDLILYESLSKTEYETLLNTFDDYFQSYTSNYQFDDYHHLVDYITKGFFYINTLLLLERFEEASKWIENKWLKHINDCINKNKATGASYVYIFNLKSMCFLLVNSALKKITTNFSFSTENMSIYIFNGKYLIKKVYDAFDDESKQLFIKDLPTEWVSHLKLELNFAEPPRPSHVPPEAIWVKEDIEWTLKEINDKGIVHCKYWTVPNGYLLCEQEFIGEAEDSYSVKRYHPNGEVSRIANVVNGNLHGLNVWIRSKEDTPEKFLIEEGHEHIWKVTMMCDNGKIVEEQFWDKDGNEIKK